VITPETETPELLLLQALITRLITKITKTSIGLFLMDIKSTVFSLYTLQKS